MAGLAAGTPRAWRDGPVRYLLTEDEHEAFGRLRTDEARASFVERFWKNLDPDPSTERNEFRETYEARCVEAAARFEAIGGPAWASDRGRVLILLGEPREVRRETAGLLAVEKEVWVYPSSHGTSGIEIPFYRCEDGGYRLDPTCPPVDPRGTSVEWYRANAARWAGFGAPTLTRSQAEDVVASIVGTGRATEAPTRRSRPTSDDERAGGAAGDTSPAPFADAAYFFRAQDGSVLTLLAVELPEGPGTDAAREGNILAAVTLEERAAGRTRTILLERAPPADGARVFSGRTYLPARSSHAARFAIKDDAKEEILVRNRRLDVPDLSGFAASSIVPAERFGPAGTDGRWVAGSEEVVPRPAAVFRRGELLRLYFQVYGAAPDPATSMARVDVSFRFTCDAKSRPRAIREPYKVTGAAGASMGLALPIGDWPEGAYRVHVDLHDRVSGRRASVAGAFRIVGR